MNKDLIDAIESILKNVSKTTTVVKDLSIMKADVFYELYVFLLVSESLGRIKSVSNIRWQNLSSSGINIRKAPGKIYSARNFSYISFECNSIQKKAYEMHLDLKYEGETTVLHELDISILSAKEASRCKSSKTNPKNNSLILGIECKKYSSTLGISLGRQFVGLIDDMKKSTIFEFASNNYSKSIATYFSPSKRPFLYGNLTPDGSGVFTKREEDFIIVTKKELEKKLLYLSTKP